MIHEDVVLFVSCIYLFLICPIIENVTPQMVRPHKWTIMWFTPLLPVPTLFTHPINFPPSPLLDRYRKFTQTPGHPPRIITSHPNPKITPSDPKFIPEMTQITLSTNSKVLSTPQITYSQPIFNSPIPILPLAPPYPTLLPQTKIGWTICGVSSFLGSIISNIIPWMEK